MGGAQKEMGRMYNIRPRVGVRGGKLQSVYRVLIGCALLPQSTLIVPQTNSSKLASRIQLQRSIRKSGNTWC